MRTLMALAVIVALFVAPVQAARWSYVDRLNAQSYQLFVREWGRLTAICSAGAFYTDGKITRLLTAGHCVAGPQADLGETVEFLVTQTGSDFQSARVLDSGWRLRKPADGANRVSLRDFPKTLPTPGFLTAQQGSDRIDISRGDWAILEIDGKKDVAALGDSTALQEDDSVYLYGYPLGGDRFFAHGYIANRNYRAPGTEWSVGYIAADVTAAPGNSGSLVVDENDKVIGVLVAGAGDRLHILTPISLIRKNAPCLGPEVCTQGK